MSEHNEGDRVLYWSGAMCGEPSGQATILSGPHSMGHTRCFRIRKDTGGTDYIAVTHLWSAPDEHRAPRRRPSAGGAL